MSHLHDVYDDDLFSFEIDKDTRAIMCTHDDPLIIAQGDHNSEIFTFTMPRIVEGHDMLLCDSIQVHYINISSDGKNSRNTGMFKVTDFNVTPDDDDTTTFTWTVTSKATQYIGSLNFAVRFMCTAGNKITYSWATTAFSSVSVVASINNSETIAEQNADILETWYNELLMAGSMGVNMVYDARDKAIEDLKNIDIVVEVEQDTIDRIEAAGDQVMEEVRNTGIEQVRADSKELVTDLAEAIRNDGLVGYIEINNGELIKLWKGTLEQYAALPEKDPSVKYWITDDGTIDALYNKINELIDDVNTLKDRLGDGTYTVRVAERAPEIENIDHDEVTGKHILEKAFTFTDMTGIGVDNPNINDGFGLFTVNDDGNTSTSLVPFHDGKQSIGHPDYKLKDIHTSRAYIDHPQDWLKVSFKYYLGEGVDGKYIRQNGYNFSYTIEYFDNNTKKYVNRQEEVSFSESQIAWPETIYVPPGTKIGVSNNYGGLSTVTNTCAYNMNGDYMGESFNGIIDDGKWPYHADFIVISSGYLYIEQTAKG